MDMKNNDFDNQSIITHNYQDKTSCTTKNGNEYILNKIKDIEINIISINDKFEDKFSEIKNETEK